MLKKILGVSVVVAALTSHLYAEEKGGIFVGVSAGISIFNTSSDFTYSNMKVSESKTSLTLALGARAGYSMWFTSMFGARAYVEYDFSGNARIPGGGRGLATHDITANIDALFNFVDTGSLTFGAFVGVGFGYGIPQLVKFGSDDKAFSKFVSESNGSYNGFILPINVGVSMGIGQRQRVEIGAKIPTIVGVVRPKGNNKDTLLSIRPNSIYATYLFTF